MTCTLSAPTKTPEPVTAHKLWDVQDYGIVPIENSVWLFCKDTPRRDELKMGESDILEFHSGAGTSWRGVKRVQ